jgi:hypothetical protein
MLGQEKYNLLIANEEFLHIKLALDEVRTTILTHDKFKIDDIQVGYFAYSPIDNTGKKRSKNQKLAWLYQACERMALDMVIDKMPQNYDMLLPVHDCLYIRQKLPSHVIIDLKDQLKQVFELLDFEQEQISPIQAAVETDDTAHKQRIAAAEREAVGYKSAIFDAEDDSTTKADFSTVSNEEYEQRRKLQFLIDLHKHEKDKQQDADYFE